MLYQTHVKVHLNNIRDNILGIKNLIGPQKKILLAVKANGYGHGSVAIAQMAEKIGVNWLGVATVPEGIELRQAGIKLPILKFSPAFEEEIFAAVENNLTLCVCSRENATYINQAAYQQNKQVNIHIKIDTGMGRIGVDYSEAAELAFYIKQSLPNLQIEGVFTHLPVSDDGDGAYTHSQIELFKKVVQEIEAKINQKIPIVHSANSGGILGHATSWLDMVRPGIMLYGFYPSNETPKTINLKPGLSFFTKVSFLKLVKKGTSIGYGRTWIAPEDTWIATIPAGYADGFNRLFSNQGRALINGKSYPIVGRVCMDQTMLNLGPDTEIKVGDEVVLIGKSGELEISAYEWAEKLKTITYEVTCQINSRVQRFYSEY